MCDIERYPVHCRQLAQGIEEEWEVRLFIEAAIANYMWLEPLRKQKIDFWKYENDSNKIKTSEEILFFLQSRLAIVEMIGYRLGEYFNNDMKQIFEEEAIDVQTIVSSSENVMDFYHELIDLNSSFKFVDAIPSYRCIVKELYNVVESVCKTFDVFYHKLLIAKGALEKLLAGESEEEHIQLDLSISLQIDTDRLMEMVGTIL